MQQQTNATKWRWRSWLALLGATGAVILINLGGATTAKAQSFQELVNRCTQQRDVDACMEMRDWIGSVGRHPGTGIPPRQESSEDRDLARRCYSGDVKACQEDTEKSRAEIRRLEQWGQMYDRMYGPGSGWSESFRYGH